MGGTNSRRGKCWKKWTIIVLEPEGKAPLGRYGEKVKSHDVGECWRIILKYVSGNCGSSVLSGFNDSG
jgi:hypothetical protein